MSEPDPLTTVVKDDNRSFQFETDSSNNSLDISDQITIQNFTCEGEEGRFVKESHENMNTCDQWIHSTGDKREQTDVDPKHLRSENSEKQIVESEESLENDGEIWTEDDQEPVLRMEDEENSASAEEIHPRDKNPLISEQKVSEDDEIKADHGDKAEEPVEAESTKASEETVRCTNEDTDDAKHCKTPQKNDSSVLPDEGLKIDLGNNALFPVSSSGLNKCEEVSGPMVSDNEVGNLEKSDILNSLNNHSRISEDIVATADKLEVQVSLALDENKQMPDSTNNVVEDEKNINISVLEGTVTDNDKGQSKMPDTTNSDSENGNSEPIYKTENIKALIHDTEESCQAVKVQKDEMEWETDTNTSDWGTDIFDDEVQEKTNHDNNLAECQSQNGGNSSNVEEGNVENITSETLDNEFGQVNLSAEVGIPSDHLMENEEQDYKSTNSNNNNNQNTEVDETRGEEQEGVMEGLSSSDKIQYKRECKLEKELDSDPDQDESVEPEAGIVMPTDNATEVNGSDEYERPAGGQKRENESTDKGPVKKTMKNIERVRQKLEEIMEKSRIEEDIAISELQQMRQEKAEILKAITKEMEILKSLLAQGKGKGPKKQHK